MRKRKTNVQFPPVYKPGMEKEVMHKYAACFLCIGAGNDLPQYVQPKHLLI